MKSSFSTKCYANANFSFSAKGLFIAQCFLVLLVKRLLLVQWDHLVESGLLVKNALSVSCAKIKSFF